MNFGCTNWLPPRGQMPPRGQTEFLPPRGPASAGSLPPRGQTVPPRGQTEFQVNSCLRVPPRGQTEFQVNLKLGLTTYPPHIPPATDTEEQLMLYAMLAASATLIFVLVLAVPAKAHRLARLFLSSTGSLG